MTSVTQINANRANAQKSTGPTSEEGKARASRNAFRHGLRSQQMFVGGEDPKEFKALCEDISASLRPVGVIEHALAHRVAVTLWRQRRLLAAEAAAITLRQRDHEIAKALDQISDPEFGSNVRPEHLEPFDEGHAKWCQNIIDEVTQLEVLSWASIRKNAPLVMGQLTRDTEDEDQTPEQYLEQYDGGATVYVAELYSWCCKELNTAEVRPKLLAMAEQVRTRHLVLDEDALNVFARYQTTLDNQLMKVLRAYRSAQEWRLNTLEPCGEAHADDVSAEV